MTKNKSGVLFVREKLASIKIYITLMEEALNYPECIDYTIASVFIHRLFSLIENGSLSPTFIIDEILPNNTRTLQ
jgi:hypothetical protein